MRHGIQHPARLVPLAFLAAIADFYASDAGTALTAAQLADPGATPPTPAQREAIAAFFASPTGAKFNALLSDAAVREELQLALAFVAGPGTPP